MNPKKDPAFVKRLKDRWNELKPSFDRIPTFIDQQAKILEKAQERNFEVWDINETITWVMMPSLGSYSAEETKDNGSFRKTLLYRV